MSALVPSPLDCIGLRRFAFYPPIKNTSPNEWLLGSGSWTEVQVVNAETGGEIWIPRRYIGAVADPNGRIPIVGLTKELAYRRGILEPRVKRVIEMPHKSADESKPAGAEERHRPPGPAPVVGIRTEDRADSTMSRALVTFGVGALIVSLIAAVLALFNSCTAVRGTPAEHQPANPAASRVPAIGSRSLFDHLPNSLGRGLVPTFAQLR